MKCNICGMEGALVRECELDTAKITHRAHVQCNGHAEYRHVADEDIEEAREAYRAIERMVEGE